MATQFDKLAAKYAKRMEFVAKAASIQVGNEIVQGTPVDKGLAKASWQGAIGKPKGDLTPALNRSPEIEFEITLRDFGIGDVIYFTNPQPYIIPLEFGWSAQAPSGMVRKAVSRWDQIVAQKAQDSKVVFR